MKATQCTKIFRYLLSLAIPIMLIPLAYIGTKEARCAYVMLLMISFWILQPIPLAVTSLFPVVFFPLFGILSTADACAPYASPFVIFMLGGLLMSVAMEHSRIHQRLALKILLTVGTSNVRLLVGFISCTGFLSMWFSNTASSAMMVPIAEGIIVEKQFQKKNIESGTSLEILTSDSSKHFLQASVDEVIEEKESQEFMSEISILRKGLLLGIAYASSIGGTGTLIGAGSNIVLVGYVNELFPGSTEINFASWLIYAVPGMITALIACGMVLYFTNIRKCSNDDDDGASDRVEIYLRRKYLEQGPISFQQGSVIFLIVAFVLVLFCREPKIIPGWGSAFPETQLKDATPAIAVCLLLFIVPSRPLNPFSSPPLLEWNVAQKKLSWGLMLIMGGGFSLTNGFQKSGLSSWVQSHLSHLDFLSPTAVLAVLLVLTTGLTELTTNTSTASSFLPIVADLASVMRVNPLFFMVPVAVTCSYAFMFPVATPSNALVFESGRMNIKDMALPGFIMNVISCVISVVLINTLGVPVLGIGNLPDWADYNRLQSNMSSSQYIIHEELNTTTIF